MKILYGITKSNFGGAQRYVYELSSAVKKEGHDVAVLCGGNGLLVDKLKAENIRVITIPGFGRDIDLIGDIPRLLFIIKTIWREKPDVFHINSTKMGGVGIFAGRLCRVPKIIFTIHGWAFNEPRPIWQKVIIKFLAWLTILGAHQTISVSEKTKRDMARWPFIKKKLVVIKNGIKPFELAPQTPRETLVVGTIGELHRIKGFDILLKAWGKFIKKHDGILVIIGEGEEREKLENMAKIMDLSGRVVFKGFVDNARTQLLSFDIFCLPSRSEAMPYVLLEAGFAGLAVVASSVGGIPEVIENGINGALVPPEDSEALFSSLVLFHDNPRMRDRLGTNLKATIRESFSVEKMVQETLQIYL